MIRMLLFGAGRMARSLIELAPDYPEFTIVGQVSRSRPSTLSEGPPFFASLDEAGNEFDGGVDLLVDFSLPAGTLTCAQWCGQQQVAMLSGVTGITAEIQDALERAAESAPVLWAANLSPGINLLAGILHDVGRAIGAEAPVTIEEVHHAGKKDAPSGTALILARQLREPGNVAAAADPRHAVGDFPGIEFISRREGHVVGDHSVSIALDDETLTFSHHAADRRLFARGAFEAGQWLVGQPPGRYSAADWIRSMILEGRPGGDS